MGLGTGEPGEGKMYDSACFSLIIPMDAVKSDDLIGGSLAVIDQTHEDVLCRKHTRLKFSVSCTGKRSGRSICLFVCVSFVFV